jgi:2-polyprenyl-3-methyl-5-hydroxy-6-metoxy-1,4-benzoquinol methylase
MTSYSRFLHEGAPCNCCGGTRYRTSLSGFDLRVGIPTDFQLCECQECHLVCLQPQPDFAQLARHYPDWLWQNEIDRQEISHAKFKPVLDLLNRRQPAHGHLLDVGCGPGDFVALAQQADWQAYGIEVSPNQVKFAQERGLPVSLCEDFMMYTSEIHFQAVVFNHVLEHVPSPKEYLMQGFRLLSPGGILVVAVPNYACLSRRVFRQYWTHLDLPRHIFQYTPKTLSHLIRSAGGRVLEVRFNDHIQDSLGVRDSARRWIQQGLLHRPVKYRSMALPKLGAGTRQTNLKRWLIYIYRTCGNVAATLTEVAHLADTFVVVAALNENENSRSEPLA